MSKKTTRDKKRSRARVVWRRWGDWRKIAIALGTALLVALLLTVELLPDKVAVHLNEPSPQDVFAPRTVRYYDPIQTQQLRRLVANQVAVVYSTIGNAASGARAGVTAFFTGAEEIRKTPDEPGGLHRLNLIRKLAPGLAAEHLRTALELYPEEFSRSRDAALAIVDTLMSQNIRQEEVAGVRRAAVGRAMETPLSLRARKLVGAVAAANVTYNQFVNDRETAAAREREMDRVPPQYVTIKSGDLILRKGEKVLDEHLRKLSELGIIQERLDVVTALSLILLAFGLVAVFSLYLYQFHPAILRSVSSLLLIAVVVCLSLFLFRLASTTMGLRFSGDQLGFIGMSCSALGAMLLAALLCPQIAVFVGIALALLTSVLVGAELKFAILSIVSSLVGVQLVTNIRNRADIARAGITLSAVNVVTALVAQGATQSNLPDKIGQSALWAVIGGFTSVLLFWLFAAWLERPFRLTTHLTLLELSDPSHPLLRRLQMEAPGTYAHSIIVGNLSEAAAEAIGADGLFCRVASYYHDIGKVMRPHFFVENQLSENRHDEINPSLSSLIVTSHVRDGVELAEEYRLPPPIIAIIKEHHGTCLIKYFYHRAVTAGGEENTPALEYQFRYDGPRPQTKESGVIMIADSAEAASRTLEKPTPGRIRDLIERIVRDRLSDGQLDECELTFKDLEKVIASMTRSLTSLLHARIEYPAGDTNKLRRLAADGAAHKEPVGSRNALADTPETASAALGRPAGL